MELLMKILLTMILILSLASLNSLLSYFIDYCLYKGEIFGRWLPWLSRFVVIHFYKEHHDEIGAISDPDTRGKRIWDIASGHALFKIIGGCIICSNVWLSIITFNILFFVTGLNGLWYFSLIAYIALSSFIVRKISKND